jgi:hypothetical protein
MTHSTVVGGLDDTHKCREVAQHGKDTMDPS